MKRKFITESNCFIVRILSCPKFSISIWNRFSPVQTLESQRVLQLGMLHMFKSQEEQSVMSLKTKETHVHEYWSHVNCPKFLSQGYTKSTFVIICLLVSCLVNFSKFCRLSLCLNLINTQLVHQFLPYLHLLTHSYTLLRTLKISIDSLPFSDYYSLWWPSSLIRL